jgi:hypothetical protein
MTDRASYYASLPEYYNLEELRKMIFKAETEDKTIIDFIKEHKLNVDSYIKGLKANEWVPVLHMAARSSRRQALVKFLIKSGANLNLLPDAEPELVEPLLFICDEMYFKYFVEHGYNLNMKDARKLRINIQRRLRCADIRRLRLLVKVKQLEINDIIGGEMDVVLYCLTSMKDYLTYAFNIRQNIVNLTEELQEVTGKFLDCIKQLLDWGATVSKEAAEFAVNYYLYEFLSLPAFKVKLQNFAEVPYHEHLDKLTVAMLRPLLNDARYEKTCLSLGQKPCEELFISARSMI